MKVSVVIPVSDDTRLKDCILSIDEDVEVVVAMNGPTEEIRRMVKDLQKRSSRQGITIKSCITSEKSIAQAYNAGIETATYPLILLMDSDCTFSKGCIRRLYSNIGSKKLSKGRVVFSHNSLITSIVSASREFHTSDEVNAYSPPLLFHKGIRSDIGGYFFHHKLCWLEDSEFDRRVRQAGLEIAYDSTATVIHPPLTPLRDLRSAFWYGVGKRIGVENGLHEQPTGLLGSVKKYIFHASAKKGVAAGIYLFIWKCALLFGYFYQKYCHIR